MDIPCNPYDETRNYLRLQCDISIPRNRRSSIDVVWYRIQAGETEAESIFGRGPGKGAIVVRKRLSTGDLTLIQSSLQLQNITEEDMGVYWCQIEDEEGEEPIIHRPCTTTILSDPDTYDHLTVCPDRTNFFTLGPLCAVPRTECSSMQSSPPLPSSTPAPSTTTITTPVNNPRDNAEISEWFITITVSVVLLLVLLILGALTTLLIVLLKARQRWRRRVSKTGSSSAWCLKSHDPQSQYSSNSLPETPVVCVHVPQLASTQTEMIMMPRHLNVGRQLSDDSVYAEPNCPVRIIHNTETNMSETGSLYSNPHFYQEASEDIASIERDGNFYQIIAKSTTTPEDEKLVNYTVPTWSS